jgi:predicted oxidoreductase
MNRLKIDSSHRSLGQSDLNCFPLAYGCWRFAGTNTRTAREKIDAALEVGIDLFDHADVYGCDGGGQFGDAEALFGKVLKESPGLRDQMLIATKGGIVLGTPYDSSPAYLRSAVESSLTRLGIEVIDLYQIHRPDFLGHPEKIAAALTSLRDAGKIREVGVSNHTVSQFNALQAHLSFPIATHQPEFSCWKHGALRNGILDQCLEKRVTPLAWSPLGGGVLGLNLSEARSQPNGESLAALLAALDSVAEEQGVPRVSVALAWIMLHPSGIVPIIGTQTVGRILQCSQALQVQMTRAQWYQILVSAQGEPLP